MELLCHQLNERLAGAHVRHCFPNDLYRFYLRFEKNRQRETLFFCFSPPWIRFHLATDVLNSPSTHPLNVYLQDAVLSECSLLQQDRILQLTFQTPKEHYRFIGEFFPRHPNYTLVRSDGTILFTLHQLERTHYQLPAKHSLPVPQSHCLAFASRSGTSV